MYPSPQGVLIKEVLQKASDRFNGDNYFIDLSLLKSFAPGFSVFAEQNLVHTNRRSLQKGYLLYGLPARFVNLLNV